VEPFWSHAVSTIAAANIKIIFFIIHPP